mmetsp:Transcript_62971/g.150012  ORF Transcript_62971/g.150012 Transcript_62971/m.150012 type:complete len:253 (-) Transcript_62971:104-862(-)
MLRLYLILAGLLSADALGRVAEKPLAVAGTREAAKHRQHGRQSALLDVRGDPSLLIPDIGLPVTGGAKGTALREVRLNTVHASEAETGVEPKNRTPQDLLLPLAHSHSPNSSLQGSSPGTAAGRSNSDIREGSPTTNATATIASKKVESATFHLRRHRANGTSRHSSGSSQGPEADIWAKETASPAAYPRPPKAEGPLGLPKLFWALVADLMAMIVYVALIPIVLNLAKKPDSMLGPLRACCERLCICCTGQ